MRVVTKEEIVSTVLSRFKAQYPGKTDWKMDRLASENPLTEEKAVEIIGNKSWTSNYCDECNKDAQSVVQFGEDHPDIDSPTFSVCMECLTKAVGLIHHEKTGI